MDFGMGFGMGFGLFGFLGYGYWMELDGPWDMNREQRAENGSREGSDDDDDDDPLANSCLYLRTVFYTTKGDDSCPVC